MSDSPQPTQETSYQEQFIEFQPKLRSFIYRLVTNKQDMEDLVQETYIKAFNSLDGFKGTSSFKTWVFTIAMNEARNLLKKQQRWHEDYQDNCRTATYQSKELQGAMFAITQASPQGKYVLKEHVEYCFTCMSKTLVLEEQCCVILKEMYGFRVNEIQQITGLTEGKVKYHLTNGRKRLQEIFDQRCSLIGKQGACHQCTELNGMFNPKQNAQEEAMKLKLSKAAGKENNEQLFNLRLQLVNSIDPLAAEGFDFHNFMLEHLPEHS